MAPIYLKGSKTKIKRKNGDRFKIEIHGLAITGRHGLPD